MSSRNNLFPYYTIPSQTFIMGVISHRRYRMNLAISKKEEDPSLKGIQFEIPVCSDKS